MALTSHEPNKLTVAHIQMTGYNNENAFRNLLEQKCRIVRSQIISKTGRKLYWFERPAT